jgi:hypothetical protein
MKNPDLLLYFAIWAWQMIPVTLMAFGGSAWLRKDGWKILGAGALLGVLGAVLALCLLPADQKPAAKRPGPKRRKTFETGIR